MQRRGERVAPAADRAALGQDSIGGPGDGGAPEGAQAGRLLQAVRELARLVGQGVEVVGLVGPDVEQGGVVDGPFDLAYQPVFGLPACVLDGLTAQIDLGRVGRKAHARTVLERVLVPRGSPTGSPPNGPAGR